MIYLNPISTSISRAVISVCLLLSAIAGKAQKPKRFTPEADTIALFRGFQVMGDLVGPIQRALSDYGQYEGALRLNLRDKYFPIVEIGYGTAHHTDDPITHISYKTSAPYGKIGMDVNMLKNKHDIYRVYVGGRYAFTSFQYDVANALLKDPVWKEPAPVDISGAKAYCHWAELVFSVDAKIWGPIHLGWSARYLRRLFHDDGEAGKVWYVPGFGKTGGSRLTATFNVMLEF